MNQVEEIFKRVRFDEADRQIHEEFYRKVKDIAISIGSSTPKCREQSLAFTHLQEALMWVGVALSKQEKYQESVSNEQS